MTLYFFRLLFVVVVIIRCSSDLLYRFLFMYCVLITHSWKKYHGVHLIDDISINCIHVDYKRGFIIDLSVHIQYISK